ncbi:serine hydrolase [Duganella sp. SAP-35]|uniref:Serine hydrolase n=2 Tax=Duganella aceris TaxID=2703883 RepID=A0ABX0FP02_9BURK|nr:serine hydrolase [Duganella aceris]
MTLTLMAAAGTCAAAPPAHFDARVEALRKQIGVPGMAIAIVEDGKTTLARGYGIRQLGAPATVDADTLFPIGSTSKAFTTAALATLVDAGKIGWDDPVIDHLPDFRMADPWVTRELTIRDLLVHRSGLGYGTGDLLFVPRSNVSRAEAVRRLRYLKPTTSFRTTFAYSNLMYVVAGQLIEAVSGQRWEDYVRDHVLLPAGMRTSTADNERNFATEDRAYPHARMNGGLRGAGDQERLDERDDLGRNAAPAGGIASSANDLARWLQVQLAAGKTADGQRVFSDKAHQQMWAPVVQMPISQMPPELKPLQSQFSSYALGWDVVDYRGVRVIWHGGAVFGFKTAVVILPEKKVGFAITINSEDGALIRGLMYELMDHYLGFAAADWPAKFQAFSKQQVTQGLDLLKSAQASPAKVGPSVTPASLAGTYKDPWYGDIEIAATPAGLGIDFKSTPRMGGKLEHWQYDTYITRFDDKTIEPAYVTFALDQDGKVARMTMKAASPIADFSWDYHDLNFTPVKGKQ